MSSVKCRVRKKAKQNKEKKPTSFYKSFEFNLEKFTFFFLFEIFLF